jgi:hypothetical protein
MNGNLLLYYMYHIVQSCVSKSPPVVDADNDSSKKKTIENESENFLIDFPTFQIKA